MGRSVGVFICLALPLLLCAHAEYIEITYPHEGQVFLGCGPNEILWESDIDPAEGDVIRVAYDSWWFEDGWTIGIGPNDGIQPWGDPPCYPENGIIPVRYYVRVEYLPDPSVYGQVYFWNRESEFDTNSMVVDFSGDAVSDGDLEHRIDPPLYTSIEAYIAMVHPEPGFTSVSFALEVGPPGVLSPPACENLLPGDLAIGHWEDGITLASTECQQGGIVYVASATTLYLGGEGYVLIKDHPDYPRWVTDCDEPAGLTEYVLGSHGGVSRQPPSTPVRPTSWGSIKAMFRGSD